MWKGSRRCRHGSLASTITISLSISENNVFILSLCFSRLYDVSSPFLSLRHAFVMWIEGGQQRPPGSQRLSIIYIWKRVLSFESNLHLFLSWLNFNDTLILTKCYHVRFVFDVATHKHTHTEWQWHLLGTYAKRSRVSYTLTHSAHTHTHACSHNKCFDVNNPRGYCLLYKDKHESEYMARKVFCGC